MWGREETETAETQPPVSPARVKLLKKKKVLVFPLQMNAEGHPGTIPQPPQG